MDANDALGRVKTELSKAWLSAPERIAALSIRNAEPTHRGEFEIRSVFAAREVESVEEPLARDPIGPSRPFDLWEVNWPPESEKSLGSTKIDVRETYEVLACPACAQAGETMCGVCRGSGKVADPKTNKPTRCSGCRGKGTIACARCQGRGRLLRFKRINQRVKNVVTKFQLPDGSKTPTGVASGNLDVSEQTPSSSADALARTTSRLSSAAPDLEVLGWPNLLAQRFVSAVPPSGDRDARAGWRTIKGRWYEGWKLHCTSNGKSVDYFVPDTGANIVGPKLRSPSKLAALAGTLVVVLVGMGGLINWRMDISRNERIAQEQHDTQLRAESEKKAAGERAAKEAADRKQAEQQERQRIAQAIAQAKQASAALITLKNKSAADRRAGFEALSTSLATTKGAPEATPIAEASAAPEQTLQRIRELDKLAASSPVLPEVPEKPTFEKPEYHGAFYLDGEVRGNYEGDPVIQAGDKFFVVRGVGGVWFDGKYVEASILTVTLNIGRDGREATIVDVAARETYNDDHERYAAEVKTARDIFQKELADYNAAVKTRQVAEAKARQEKQARDAERAKMQAQLDGEIVKLIAALTPKP